MSIPDNLSSMNISFPVLQAWKWCQTNWKDTTISHRTLSPHQRLMTEKARKKLLGLRWCMYCKNKLSLLINIHHSIHPTVSILTSLTQNDEQNLENSLSSWPSTSRAWWSGTWSWAWLRSVSGILFLWSPYHPSIKNGDMYYPIPKTQVGQSLLIAPPVEIQLLHTWNGVRFVWHIR